MLNRYLIGPISCGHAYDRSGPPRLVGARLTFGPGGDIPVAAADGWPAVAARLPAGWVPDAVVVWLARTPVPRFAREAQLPVVGVAADWHLRWHAYRHAVPACDAVLADAPGAERMRRAGWDHVVPAHPAVVGRFHHDNSPGPDAERDIDLLIAGGTDPAADPGRPAWVARVAGLAGRHRVAVAAGDGGAGDRALLRRAKVVIDRSAFGGCNARVFAAAAAGAVLLLEAGSAEVPRYLEPEVEYLPYTDHDIEAVVGRVLADDGLRRAVAARARERVAGYTFDQLLPRALAGLDPDRLRERVATRLAGNRRMSLAGRVWQRVAFPDEGSDPDLLADLVAAGDHAGAGLLAADSGVAGPALRRAADAGNRVSAAVLADFLLQTRRPAEAARELGRLLADLDEADPTPAELDTPPGPPGLDDDRVAWERAAWEHAGDAAGERRAKATLLRWRARVLLHAATGDPAHLYEAAVLRPDLPAGRAALGAALARAGRVREAVPHLQAAVAGDPFDLDAARACAAALADTGAVVEGRRLARSRFLLHAAAPALVPAEDWFAPPAGGDPAPVSDELVSVVVLCCDEVGYTRLCLASVLRHTRPPFELVVVDNGSTDATPEYLREVAAAPGPDRVTVIRNETNLGFPHGVNQARAAARGDWLVLLNNDAVVTPRWLDRLLGVAVAGWPGVGLVGPVSNAAPDAQHLPAGYADLGGLDGFARTRWEVAGGEVVDVPRLTGFCLLAHRRVADRLGPLDEGYGLGLFEDDDWCARARGLGVGMRVAGGVYVHHFGSRTFAALGIDMAAALAANLDRFRARWGAAEAAHDRPVGGRRVRVSLTMIVRDEEHNLPACLAGLRGLFDEMVVVDTGSTDRTREVAAALGARVVEAPWADDFAAARNAALDAATGDYAFWLDADDRVDGPNRDHLARLFGSLAAGGPGYVMTCRCVPDRPGGAGRAIDQVRLFPVRPDVRWEFRVHEQVIPSLRAAGVGLTWVGVRIDHTGYVDPDLRARKLARDRRLLELELRDRPGHPFALFNLGAAHHQTGDHAAALDCLTRSLAGSDPHDSIVPKAHALIAECHVLLGRPAEARAAVAAGLGHHPDDAELLFLDGSLRRQAGDLAGAEAAFRRLLAGSDGERFGSVDESLRGATARRALVEVLAAAGRDAEATAEWAAAADPSVVTAPAADFP